MSRALHCGRPAVDMSSRVQVVVGVPPQPAMCGCASSTPFGAVMGGSLRCQGGKGTLTEDEVKLAYSQGTWAANVARLMHDADHAPP